MSGQLSNKYWGTTQLHTDVMGNSSSEYTAAWVLIGVRNQTHTQGLQPSAEYCISKRRPYHKALQQLFNILCGTPSAPRPAEIGVYTGLWLLLSDNSAVPEAAGTRAGKSRKKAMFGSSACSLFLVHLFHLAALWQHTISLPCFFQVVFKIEKIRNLHLHVHLEGLKRGWSWFFFAFQNKR